MHAHGEHGRDRQQAPQELDVQLDVHVLAEHQGYLLAIARLHLPPDLQVKEGASDLVQETLLNAHEHFDQFRGGTEVELRAWLRRIFLNKLADLRKRYRPGGKRDPRLEVPLAGEGSSGDPAGAVPDGATSPSGRAMAAEQERAVQQALGRLPPDYRAALLLRIWEGLPFEEVGRALGLSPNAAEKLYARAVRRARRELEGQP
jgi:RNA polymerase sigma-70 factor (ECF subfamily)